MAELTYDEKASLIKDLGMFSTVDIKGDDAFKLLTLTCYMTSHFQAVKPDLKPLHILVKACGRPAADVEKEFFTRISLCCELFMVPDTKFNSCGLTKPEDIMAEIKNIVSKWCPF